MRFNTYRLYRGAFGILSALLIFSFAFFYFDNYLLFEGELYKYSAYYEVLEYVRLAISRAIDFATPPLVALTVFPRLHYESAYRAYPAALAVCSARLFYDIPYYYLYHIAYGYDTPESLTRCIPLAIFLAALHALYAVALAYVAKLVFQKRGGVPEDITERCSALSPTSPIGSAVLSAILIQFSLTLISELTDTVTFFVEYGDSFRIGELIYILGSFVYILVLLLLSAIICSAIYNAVIAPRVVFEENAEQN